MSQPLKRLSLAGAAAAACALGVFLSVATAAPAAGDPSGAWAGGPVVSGTVSLKATRFRENVPLPAMATVHVEVLDLSMRNPGSALLGSESIWIAAGTLPVSFRIACDPSRVDPTHLYVVRARITDNGKVLFVSATPYYVLTRGTPGDIDIVLTPLPAQ